MKTKVWYSIYGKGPSNNEVVLLAKVKSKGLAYIVAEKLKEIYNDVKID